MNEKTVELIIADLIRRIQTLEDENRIITSTLENIINDR